MGTATPVLSTFPYKFPEPRSRGSNRPYYLGSSAPALERASDLLDCYLNLQYASPRRSAGRAATDWTADISMALARFKVLGTMLELIPRTFYTQPLFRARPTKPLTRLFTHPLSSLGAISVPAISLNIPTLLGEIWDGLLRAVPKKKTSHMKKRHRQLAGKALKDVNAINTCPACGKPKRAHLLCPYCVAGM